VTPPTGKGRHANSNPSTAQPSANFQDSAELAALAPYGPKPTFTGFYNDFSKVIDFILLSSNSLSTTKVVQTGVVLEADSCSDSNRIAAGPIGRFPIPMSDHRPIVADFCFV
jgi:hypothetical protein